MATPSHGSGFALGIVTSDGNLATRFEGETGQRPVDGKTVFGIGSIAKFLTALATMQLVEQGRLNLDDPGLAFVPGLVFDDERASTITIRHLLSHTSGLSPGRRDWGPRGPESLRRFAFEDLAHYRLLASPGTFFNYSNTAYCLLGVILEEVGGAPFEAILRRSVLELAGITSACFLADLDQSSLLTDGQRIADNRSGYPSGFLFATLEDLVSLVHALQTDSLVSRATLDEMATEVGSRHLLGATQPFRRAITGYGLGCYTGSWSGRRLLRHGGMQMAYNNSFDFFPDLNTGPVLLTNALSDKQFMDLLLHSYIDLAGNPQPRVESSSHAVLPPKTWFGHYLDVSWGGSIEVDLDTRLVPLGDNHFQSGQDLLWFPDEGGDHLFVNGVPFLRWDVQSWNPANPTAFCGVFRDAFYPDASSDLTVESDETGWSVTLVCEQVKAVVVGQGCLQTDLGLIEFLNGDLQLGRATVYLKRD